MALDLVQTGERPDGPALFEGHHGDHVLDPGPAPLAWLQPGRLPGPLHGVAVVHGLRVLLRLGFGLSDPGRRRFLPGNKPTSGKLKFYKRPLPGGTEVLGL